MFIELMVANQPGTDIVVLEQHARGTGIFGKHHVNFLQDAQRPEGDILQIAYRSGDKIEHFRRG